ncbi:MAG: Cas9 inhibitor AcrIIA9 family protein [Bacteroidales bacterium]
MGETVNKMNILERIEAYLAEEVIKDPTLYLNIQSEKNIRDCYSFILDKAKKEANGEWGIMIENETVYEWIKEYYNTPIEELKKEKPEPIIKKLEVVSSRMNLPPQIQKKPKSENQLSLF